MYLARTSRLDLAMQSTIPAACAPQKKKPALKNAKILKDQITGQLVVQAQVAEVPAITSQIPDANAPPTSVCGKKKPTFKNAKILKSELVGQCVGQVESANVATIATAEDNRMLCDPRVADVLTCSSTDEEQRSYVSTIKTLNLEPVTRKVLLCTRDNRQHLQSLRPRRLCQEPAPTPVPSTAGVGNVTQQLPCMDSSTQPRSTPAIALRKGCKLTNMTLKSLKMSENVDPIDDNVTDATRTPATTASSSPEQIQVTPAVESKRREDRQAYDRALMLRMWSIHKEQIAPKSVQSLCACRVKEARKPKPKPKLKPQPELHAPSADAYIPFQAGTRAKEFERSVQALLNKISPENLVTIVDRLAAVELRDSAELSKVIKMSFGQVLRQPFYCETYADMVCMLQTRYQETPLEEGVTFKRLLINACQEEFENLSASLHFAEEGLTHDEVFHEKKKRKDLVLANMKFIGYLFMRKMLALKVIRNIVQELIDFERSSDEFPQEVRVECALELLQAVGFTLDQQQEGQILMTQFVSRLVDLKASRADGRRFYSMRMQFRIQDLVELRAGEWEK